MNNLSSPYGAYCPLCYAPVTDRERSMNGLNTCANGHRTPMGAALSLDQAAHLRAPSEIGFTPLAVAVAKERLAHDFRQIQLKQRNIIEFMILTGGRRL